MAESLATKIGRIRKYTEQQKADALAVYDSTLSAKGTAKKMGIPSRTLRDWLKDRDKAARAEVRDESKRVLLAELDKARWAYLDRLMESEAISQTSGYYAAQTFKTLNEAHQLLSGGPTARFSLADYLRGAMSEPQPAIEAEFKVTSLPSGESNARNQQPEEHVRPSAEHGEVHQPSAG